MLALLKKICVAVGWLTGALILVCLTVGLAWWAGWPLFSGVVLLCALAACVVLFIAIRQLVIWRNKRRYVRDVLTQNPAKQSPVTLQNPMTQAWQTGLQYQRGFWGRSSTGALPWALLLGQSDADCAQLVNAVQGQRVAASATQAAPLEWHLLPELLLLQVDADFAATAVLPSTLQAQWEELLTGLVHSRRHEPLNAVVLAVNATTLRESANHVREHARALRARVQELASVSEARLPVYVVVTHAERLPGVADIVSHMPVERRARVWGATFDTTHAGARLKESATPALTAQDYAKTAMVACSRMLREELPLGAASRDVLPHGDVYAAPHAVEELESGLAAFLDCLLLLTPGGAGPMVRGVYLACLASQGSSASAKNSTTTAQAEASAPLPWPGIAPVSKPVAGTMPVMDMPTPVSLQMPLQIAPEPAATRTASQPQLAPPASPLATNTPLPLAVETQAVSANTPLGSAFVDGLFLQRIPEDRQLYQPTRTDTRADRVLGSCLGAWYLVLFALCGVIAANTIYNSQTLRRINAQTVDTAVPQSLLAELNQQSLHLRQLYDATDRWWFPSLGLDRLTEERTKATTAFTHAVRQKLIPQVLDEILQSAGQRKNADAAYESVRRLIWLQGAVAERLAQGSSVAVRERPFPVGGALSVSSMNLGADTPAAAMQAGTAGKLWSLPFGEIFLEYVDRSDEAALKALQSVLGEATHTAFRGDGEQLLAYLERQININLAREAVPLSQFWPGVPAGSREYVAVPPAYTAAGYAALAEQVESLLRGVDGISTTNLAEQPFWKVYQQRYAAAWIDFAKQSDNAWAGVTQVASLYGIGMVKTPQDDPYMRLLQRMAKELEPLRGAAAAPAWLEDLFLLQALLDVATLTGATSPDSIFALPAMLTGALRSSSRDLNVLKEQLLRTRDASSMMQAITSLQTYLYSLQALRATLTSEEGSLELAKVHFGGKNYGKPEESHFTQGEQALRTALTAMGVSFGRYRDDAHKADWGSQSPVVLMARGPLRFLSHAVTCTAALALQRQWESTVAAPVALLPIESRLDALFGEKGLGARFLADQAAPFLQRQVGAYSSSRWGQTNFPFTYDFLHFIQQGQVASVHLPKDSYDVTLLSQASDVNPDAAERLQFMELTMAGKKGATSLRNNNYPARSVFTYVPQESGAVQLVLNFPSLKLTYTYTSFPEFLHEFIYGERAFGVEDFPEAEQRMLALGIRRITVRMLAENAAEVLAIQGAEDVPPMPERITRVW